MRKIIIPFFTFLMVALGLSSCRQDGATPIQNVKAGPTLLRAHAGGGSCENYTYFYDNEQKTLGNVFTKQVLVAFASGLSAEQEANIVQAFGFVKGKNGQVSSNSALLHNIELVDGLNCKQVEMAMKALADDPAITYVAPYFMNGDGLLGISNEAIVTVKEGQEDALAALTADYKAEVLMPLSGQTYLVRVDKSSSGNALDLANFLKGKEGISHAEPDFLVSLEVPEVGSAPDRRSRSGSFR
ncbi:hypothetical protein POKO110462_03570 [Pontibacter korlensis]|uniref:Uncharacterized protein n=1 Tax=Pontibacter korlensis TaxID=400092 RepID=A0A0E3UXS0_9BACT|nr:hypothetical protein [Pontibacter korlensis]AKD03826.1 hypothetical protein PKOR_12730 [Pontibacter korlensis]